MRTYEEVMDEIEELPDGDTKIERLEQAIQLADEMQDVHKGYYARKLMVNCAKFNGYPMKMLLAFSWMISVWEKNPEDFYAAELLWRYKWVLGTIDDFPQISLEKIEELFADMKTKYETHGASLRPYYFYRMNFMRVNGFHDQVNELFRLWMDTENGYLSCCQACDQARQVTFAIDQKEYQKAVDLAAPLLKASLTCKEEPGNTYARIIKAFQELDQIDQATKYAEKAHRSKSNRRGGYGSVGLVIDYLMDVDLPKAKASFEKHVRFALESENPRSKFHFYLTAAKLMKRLSERRFKIKFSFRFEKYREDGNYDFLELREWFLGQARQIAAAFDQRNGNHHFEGLVREVENE